MWMPSGCSRYIGLVIAIVGVMSAGRADGGYTSLPAPGPASTAQQTAPTADLPRGAAPELNRDRHAHVGHATPLDLPNAANFENNSDDHLVNRLHADRNAGKNRYSLFWEDQSGQKVERGYQDLGVDVKNSAPVVVPLPQGVWAGLIGLGCVAWYIHRKRRHQLA